MTVSLLTTYHVIDCFKCGALFALPENVNDELLRSGRSFYCPNGHSQHYVESAVEKLRKAEDALARERARVDQARAEAEDEKRRAAAARGQVTKIKNRVARGVCPFCNRSFSNVAEHMQTQHPDEPCSDSSARDVRR